MSYSPWGLKEVDTTEHMPTSLTQNDSVLYIISLDVAVAELSFMFFFLKLIISWEIAQKIVYVYKGNIKI